MKKIKPFFLYCAYIVLVSLVLFTLVELFARISGFKPLPPRDYNTAFWTKHEHFGFTALPNAKWSYIVSGNYDDLNSGKIAIRKIGTSNGWGFRPSVINSNCKSCPVLLTIGDSVTFGAESNDHETWPEFTVKALNERGYKYRSQNFGMSGYSSLQSYFALKEALKKVKGVDIVIYAFVMNDTIENFTKGDVHRPYFDLTLNIKKAVEKSEWDIAFKKNKLFKALAPVRFNLASLSLIKHIVRKKSYSDMNKPPYLDISDANYLSTWKRNLVSLREMQTDFLVDRPELKEGMKRSIELMAEECLKYNKKFFVFFFPLGQLSRGEKATELAGNVGLSTDEFEILLSNQDRIHEMIKEYTSSAKGKFLNVDPDLLSSMGYREYAARPDDWHYSVVANNKVGEEVAEKLEDWLKKQ